MSKNSEQTASSQNNKSETKNTRICNEYTHNDTLTHTQLIDCMYLI